MKDEHVNVSAQGVVEDVTQDVAQDLGFGARAARALLATPPPPPPCLCAVRAEIGAQLGSSVAFGSGCGQTLPGVPRKAPLCLLVSAVAHRQRPGVGGWKAPNLHVPALTDALVEITFPHLAGGRLSLKAALAGKFLEFEVPDNGGAGGGRAQASRFQGRRPGMRRDDYPRVRE